MSAPSGGTLPFFDLCVCVYKSFVLLSGLSGERDEYIVVAGVGLSFVLGVRVGG